MNAAVFFIISFSVVLYAAPVDEDKFVPRHAPGYHKIDPAKIWQQPSWFKTTSGGFHIDCWGKCGEKGGKCNTDACGLNGFCCRKDWSDCPKEAAQVSLNYHTCVLKRT